MVSHMQDHMQTDVTVQSSRSEDSSEGKGGGSPQIADHVSAAGQRECYCAVTWFQAAIDDHVSES